MLLTVARRYPVKQFQHKHIMLLQQNDDGIKLSVIEGGFAEHRILP